MTTPIQHLVMPKSTFGTPEAMYVRIGNTNAYSHILQESIHFKVGGSVSWDTFFNGISVAKWKRHCSIDNLFLKLVGTGKFTLRFGLHRLGHPHRWLHEQEIDLTANGRESIVLPFWPTLKNGLLYLALQALTEAQLHGGLFYTSTVPINPVKLGIVITHFNRKTLVLKAVQRIQKALNEDPSVRDQIKLVIVDNSKNIEPSEIEDAIVIPNSNLGGSGGFACGLMHLTDDGTFTHCLFMDDDASCDVESIRRVYHLFQFARRGSIAVSGSLLRDVEPYRLYEKGAIYDVRVVPLNQGLDMRKIHDLLLAESTHRNPDYGAWWFFAFSISHLKFFPFPFFVRGDDILFSIQNKFDIVTLNGIASWGEDFWYKESPITRYLSCRSTLVLLLLLTDLNRFAAARLMIGWFVNSIFSYNYSSAKAIRLSIKHVCQGSGWWRKNIDLSTVRNILKKLAEDEKLSASDHSIGHLDQTRLRSHRPHQKQVVNLFTNDQAHKTPVSVKKNRAKKEGTLRFIVRIMTLNGFLLPDFLLWDRAVYQPKHFGGVFCEIFRYKRIYYEYKPLNIGYVASHDKSRFFSEACRFGWPMLVLLTRFSIIRDDFKQALPEMTSKSYWRNVLEGHAIQGAGRSIGNRGGAR